MTETYITDSTVNRVLSKFNPKIFYLQFSFLFPLSHCGYFTKSAMAPRIKPGDRVIIEIRSQEVYEGTVEYFSSQSIELYDIYCQTTDTHYEGNMTFYRDEVVTISYITASSATSSSETSAAPNENTYDISKKIKLNSDEFARLKEMTLNYMFIDIYDKRFKDAVQVLNSRESIGVVGLGNNFKRGKPLSLLLVADFKQVYIFDLLCLVDLRSLRDILESRFIVKVVHDGAALFDCLYHKYGVEMNNVFDTQIVDSMMSKDKNSVEITRNISECLAHHFNFPLALLAAAMEDNNEKTWLERPVLKSNKVKAAQLVTYLLTLRDHLQQKILQKYSDSVQRHYNKYKCMTDVEMLTKTMSLNGIKD